MKFFNHFAGVYGPRWPALLASLRAEPSGKVLLNNPFGLQDYSLDEASLVPALALSVSEGERVADFCSAPGGKLLAMIFQAARLGVACSFVANDLSPARVQRLKAVLHDCVAPAWLARVEVRRGDASRWGIRSRGSAGPGSAGRGSVDHESAMSYFFDKILVDAPCSGERHLLASPRELERWTLKGSRRLAVRQHALLCSALDCLRPGGRLVYSTCSISGLENDGVIERLLESREGLFSVVPPDRWFTASDGIVSGEPTQFGSIVLPDVSGRGPIFTSVLEKNS